jgi:hypothetical protein
VVKATTCIPKHTLALFSFVIYTIQVSARELRIKLFFPNYSTRGAQDKEYNIRAKTDHTGEKTQHFHLEMPETIK